MFAEWTTPSSAILYMQQQQYTHTQQKMIRNKCECTLTMVSKLCGGVCVFQAKYCLRAICDVEKKVWKPLYDNVHVKSASSKEHLIPQNY